MVLSRCTDEKILIGDNIEVIVCGISHGKVKLGIEAPKDVLILREELVGREPKNDKKHQEKKAA